MNSSILVATDASPPANRALAVAIDMATKYDAELHIMYVIRDMQLPANLRKMAEIENFSEARGDVLMFVANQVLSDATERANKRGLKNVKTFVGSGDPAGAIINYSKRRKNDLVELGTRGLSKTEGLLLGSVSRKVLNLCKISCMVVR